MKLNKTWLYALFILIGTVITKTVVAQAPPSVYTNINTGDQTLENDTVTGSYKWYRWFGDTGVAHIGIKLNQHGINYQLAEAELYTVNSGTLVLAYRDTLFETGDSTLNLYAGYISPNTELYIKVLNASGSCTSCAVNNPIIQLNVENIMAGCAPVTPCDIVKNGGFESILAPGCGGDITQGSDCWVSYENNTEVFRRNCGAGTWFNLGVSTQNTNPILNSHSPSPNNTIIGQESKVTIAKNSNYYYSESIQSLLVDPLISGRTYSLTCWIYNYSGSYLSSNTANGAGVPCWVTFATAVGLVSSPSLNMTTNSVFPTGANSLVSFSVVPINTWTSYTHTFTYSGAMQTSLLVGPNMNMNLSSGWINHTSNKTLYITLDDISIIDITPIGITPTQNHPNCSNNIATYTLSASGNLAGSTYTWQPGGIVSNTIVVSPTVTSVYSVQSTSPSGCLKTAIPYTVNILPAPTGTIVPSSSTICPGAAVTLSVNGSGYNPIMNIWTPSPCVPASCVSSSITVTPSVTTTYTVKLSSPNGCVYYPTTTITVLTASNAISVTGNTLLCSGGQSTTLTATGGSNYTWTPSGATTSSVVVSPTVTTSYTVVGTYTCGGTATTVVTVSVTPPPSLTITPSSTVICSGNSVTLSASGASTYSWNPGALTGSTVVVTPTTTTIYTLTGANDICSNTKTISITVNPKPTVTVASKTICIGGTATLTASGASTYSWSTSATGSSITVTPTITTSYTVTGTSAAGCTNTAIATVAVTTNTIPAFSISTNPPSPVINNGTGTNTIVLLSNITNTTGLTFAWSNSATTPTTNFNLTQPEIINLTVSNPYCGTSTQSICVNYVAAACSNTTLPVLNNAVVTSTSQITASVYKVTGTLTFSLTGAIDVSNKTFMMATNSKIIVSPRAILLSNAGLRIYSCDGIWNGIELQADMSNAAGVNILDDAIIEDAYIAISAGTSTLSTMHNININGASTQFNKNYIDIKIQNSNAPSSVYTFTFSAKGMYSKSSANSPGGNLKCSSSYTPTVKSRSYIGLQCKDAGVITFTAPNGGGVGVNPEIQNKDYGMTFNTTDANVNNVNFNNAVGVAYSYSLNFAPTPAGVGIYSKNSKYLNVKPATTPTVGATTTFSNMGYSIITNGTYTVDVQNTIHTSSIQSYTTDPAWGSGANAYIWGGNVMTAGYGLNGVFATNARDVLRLNNNTFTNNYYPVTANYTVAPSSTNTMSISQNTISTTNVNGVKEGVTFNSALTFTPTASNMRIAANTFSNVTIGVKVTATSIGLRISSNTFTLHPSGTNPKGIYMSGSNTVTVDNNTIYGSLTSTNVAAFNVNNHGMLLENSAGCKVKCNTIKNVGIGIEYRGGNSSSGDGFFGNTLQYPIRRGLFITNGGIIGTQGSSSGASANQWINGTSAWPAVNTADPNKTSVGGTLSGGSASDAANSWLYVQNNGNELPDDNYITSPSFATQRYLLGTTMFSVTAGTGNYATCPTTLTALKVAQSGNNSGVERDADFIDYITNLLPASNTAITPQDKFMLKQYMFDDLTQNPSTDNTLLAFYNQQQNTSVDVYHEIDSLLANGNINAATSKNAQASQTNDITQTQNTYNTLYINGINNQSDLDNLAAIADLCPQLYGNAVYQARALLQSITYVGKVYADSCDNSKVRKSLWLDDEPTSVSVAEGVQAKLYPNPNNGTFTLAYDLKTLNEAKVSIYDISGKLVYIKSIDNLENRIAINTLNLNNGIYFIQLSDDTKLLWTDKLVIQK